MQLFSESKYTRWYFDIIERARNRSFEGYTERHHVIPRCFGGREVVSLTAREHFICHLLLVRMTIGSQKKKMVFALWRMCNDGKHRPTSRQFEQVRQDISSQLRGRDFSEETRLKMSASAKKRPPRLGKHNPSFLGFYQTPWGEFETLIGAAMASPKKVSHGAIAEWCRYRNDVPFGGRRLYDKSWKGLTPKELGFGFRDKN